MIDFSHLFISFRGDNEGVQGGVIVGESILITKFPDDYLAVPFIEGTKCLLHLLLTLLVWRDRSGVRPSRLSSKFIATEANDDSVIPTLQCFPEQGPMPIVNWTERPGDGNSHIDCSTMICIDLIRHTPSIIQR